MVPPGVVAVSAVVEPLDVVVLLPDAVAVNAPV